MDSGFGDEDDYNVYSEPWRKSESINAVYRPSRDLDKDNYGDDLESLTKTNRSVFVYACYHFASFSTNCLQSIPLILNWHPIVLLCNADKA